MHLVHSLQGEQRISLLFCFPTLSTDSRLFSPGFLFFFCRGFVAEPQHSMAWKGKNRSMPAAATRLIKKKPTFSVLFSYLYVNWRFFYLVPQPDVVGPLFFTLWQIWFSFLHSWKKTKTKKDEGNCIKSFIIPYLPRKDMTFIYIYRLVYRKPVRAV